MYSKFCYFRNEAAVILSESLFWIVAYLALWGILCYSSYGIVVYPFISAATWGEGVAFIRVLHEETESQEFE